MDKQQAFTAKGAGRTSVSTLGTDWEFFSQSFPLIGGGLPKYPYICNESLKLRRVSESKMPEFGKAHPEWLDIVPNVFADIFLNDFAISFVDKVCGFLGKIPAGFIGAAVDNLGGVPTEFCCGEHDRCT